MSRGRLTVALTEGAFRVSSGDKRLTIFAVKDLPEQQHPADFVIRLDEVLTWDPPHEDQDVSIDDLQKIAAEITEECERHGLSVAFE